MVACMLLYLPVVAAYEVYDRLKRFTLWVAKKGKR